MTEEEWLTAKDPTSMLVYLRGCRVADRDEVVPGAGPAVRCSERKVVLFVTAVCERIRYSALNEPSRRGVASLQQYSAGEISLPDLLQSFEKLRREDESGAFYPFYNGQVDEPQIAHYIAIKAAVRTAWTLAHEALQRSDPVEIKRLGDNWRQHGQSEAEWRRAYQQVETCQACLLREIVGDPFRPVTIGPSWLTSTVVSLANQMYDSRDFSAMPILADALQDASCDNPQILEHCRGPGPHVRGCFVVDLLFLKA